MNDKTGKVTIAALLATLTTNRTNAVEKMKTGDVKAGRIANAIDNDIANINRVAERYEKGYYEGK